MNISRDRWTRTSATVEARRLAALARGAGLGDSPDSALQLNKEALSLLGMDDETPLLGDVLRWQGVVLRDRGRTSEAEPLFHRSYEIATRLRYTPGRAHALNQLASLPLRRGDIVQASSLLAQALALAEECGEVRLAGMIEQNLGVIADVRGHTAAALAHYLVSLRTFEATNDQQPLCWVLNNLGLLHAKEERFDAAHAAYDRALEIARERGELQSEGMLEENRAELYLMEGRLDLALPALERGLAIAGQRGDPLRRAAGLKLRGAWERMSGRPTDAVTTLNAALTSSAVGEDALLGAEILYQLGMALHACGQADGARDAWNAALEAFERIDARRWVSRMQQRLSPGDSGRYW